MLRSNSVALQPYQVLVGQNATGKSTFLGSLQFLRDVAKYGVRHPVELAAASFYDLCFDPAEPISLAVELSVPESDARERRLRYEIEIGITHELGLQVLRENLFLLPSIGNPEAPRWDEGDFSLVHGNGEIPRRWKRVISKSEDGTVLFRAETGRKEYPFRVGAGEAALGSLLGDPDLFPLSLAGRDLLEERIWSLQLDANAMRGVSSPGEATTLYPDGSNLARVIHALRLRDPVLFEQWVRHVGTAVEGLESVDVWERPEDRSLVLRVVFAGQHREPVPSWMLSDGTLRLMALTLVSYAATEENPETYLIEEPENGLHPLAIQIVHEALSHPLANSQILCATHSPIFLAQTDLEHVLVFRRASQGYAIVRRATEVPELQEWTGHVNLADLFVTGVLA